jgi:hypothetical protein
MKTRDHLKIALSILALAALSFACSYFSIFFFGAGSRLWLFIAAPLTVITLAGLVLAVLMLRTQVWVFAGILLLAGLVSPLSLNVEPGPWIDDLPRLARTILILTPVLIPSLALVVAAALICTRLKPAQGRRGPLPAYAIRLQMKIQPSIREVAALLILVALLLAGILYHLYWLMVWDYTTDSLGNIWLILPGMAALLACATLVILLPGRWKILAGLYLLIVPAMFFVSNLARQVDHNLLTETRAGRVSRAIEAFHEREGRYPQKLDQLLPRYLLSLSEPVIIYGQGWCYDGGDDYYRLGYIFRKNWMDWNITGRVAAEKGQAPDLPPICTQEIARLR